MLKKTITVTSRNGYRIEVDISDEACLKFGCRHGDMVTVQGGLAVVKGVAPYPMDESGEVLLWVAPVGEGGGVVYWTKLEIGKGLRIVKS